MSMRDIRLITLLIILGLSRLYSQDLKPIPDLTFWNTSHKYHFHLLVRDAPLVITPSLPGILSLRDRISDIYTNPKEGIQFIGVPIDTNLHSLLPKLKNLYNDPVYNGIFGLDYYDNANPRYKLIMTYLFNITICNSVKKRGEYLEEAKKLYEEIPSKSIYKAIAYLQIRMLPPMPIAIPNPKIFQPGEKTYIDIFYVADVDSVVNTLVNDYNHSYQEWADLYEVRGDYWAEQGNGEKTIEYYTKASDYESHYKNDSICVFQKQRIHEKIVYELLYTRVGDNTFQDIITESLNELNEHCSSTVAEFMFHNYLVDAVYQEYLPKYDSRQMENELNSYADFYLKSTPKRLPEDIVYFIDAIRDIIYEKNDPELAIKMEILELNGVLRCGTIRRAHLYIMFDNLFSKLMQSGRVSDAEYLTQIEGELINNPYIDIRSRCIVNKAEICMYRHQFDSAENFLLNDLFKIDLDHHEISDVTKRRAYKLLMDIASNQGNIEKYKNYENNYRNTFPNNAYDYGDLRSFFTQRNSDFYIENVEQKNQALDELARQKGLYANEMSAKARQSESLRLSEHLNDSFRKKADYDSLIIKDQQIEIGNIKQKDTKRYGFITAGVLIALLIGISAFARQRGSRLRGEIKLADAEKRQIEFEARAKKQQMEAEKIKLELESLRAPYLDHAIGNNFKRLSSLIETSIDKNDSHGLRIAADVTRKLGIFFKEIKEGSNGVTKLLEEIRRDERYVEIVSECIGNKILWKTSINSPIAENLTVPSFSLLDFYINAIDHGELLAKENPFIQTIIDETTDSNVLLLTIENNGLGIDEISKEKGHESTGHHRVSRRFELFNQDETNRSQLLFDKEKDFANVIRDNTVIGTKVLIKIILK